MEILDTHKSALPKKPVNKETVKNSPKPKASNKKPKVKNQIIENSQDFSTFERIKDYY